MPLLNFKKQFVQKILSGKKKQTIRAMRKRPFRVGDRLYLYTGCRTKQCKKLGEAVCTKVDRIEIPEEICKTKINDIIPCGVDIIEMAHKDGFDHIQLFIDFFKKRLPFTGQIIYWEKIE
jgi:hypothetical protein